MSCRRLNYLKPIPIVATILFSSSVLPTWAQSAGDRTASGIEEVVVTARKREESLQETPIAVSAFNPDMMRNAHMQTVGALAKEVPGLSMGDNSNSLGMSIRGVGGGSLRVDPGVGVYIDGVYIPRTDTQITNIINMESVQVLRGPQGTLFGKNTAGGAMLLTMQKPGPEAQAFVSADIGNFDHEQYRIGASGPIIGDQFMAGFIVDRLKTDGYMVDAETGIDYGNRNKISVLTQFRYEAEQDLTMDLFLFYGDEDENSGPATCRLVNLDAQLQDFTAPGEDRSYVDLCTLSKELSEDDKVLMDRDGLRQETTNRLGGLTIDWDVGDLSFKSVTGIVAQDNVLRGADQDSSPLFAIQNKTEVTRQLEGNGIKGDGEQRLFLSQELNMFGSLFGERMDYTVGVFVSKENIDNTINGQFIGLGGFLGLPASTPEGPGGGLISVVPSETAGVQGVYVANFENRSAAAFAQTIFHLSDIWELTLGGRFTWEERAAEQDNYSVDEDPAVPVPNGTFLRRELTEEERAAAEADGDPRRFLPVFNPLADYIQPLVLDPEFPYVAGKDTWTQFTPSVSLTMVAPDQWLDDGQLNGAIVYLSASEGFKAGGFSPVGPELESFEPETVWTYELGFKMDMYDNRIRINGAIYTSEYDDIQLTVSRVLPGAFNVVGALTNAGQATINGMELEVTYVPIDSLTLHFTGNYIDANYQKFVDFQADPDTGEEMAIDRSDEKFANLPEQNYSLSAQYNWLTSFGEIVPRVAYYYTGETYIGLDAFAARPEFDEYTTLKEYSTVNARVAWFPADSEGLELALYVNNASDEDYFTGGNIEAKNLGSATLSRARPRTYGLELQYEW